MSVTLLVCFKKLSSSSALPQFLLDNKPTAFVNKCTHLGHIIAEKLNDKGDIIFRKNWFCGSE